MRLVFCAHYPEPLRLVVVAIGGGQQETGESPMKRHKMVLFAGLAIVVLVERNEIYQQLSEISPGDPARAMALARCAKDNYQFNVLSAEAREACYQKWLADDTAAGPLHAALRVPNEIDLAREAGQSMRGPIASDDIHRRQAADSYHPR
jgi:hypothetical protein